MGAVDISVVIVSWNVRELLRACLTSVFRSAGVSFDVCVVDNGSSDGSAGMVRSSFPQVRLIDPGRNLGFAGANNLAIGKAAGRYILFLNPDTEVGEPALASMAAFMDGRAEAGGLGCRLVFPDWTLQPSCRRFPSVFTALMGGLCLDYAFPKSRFFNYYKMGSWAHDTVRAVDVVYGACLMVRRSLIEKIGPMDERFFMYYDEIDLCYRIKKAGASVYYNPDITVLHHANKSSDQAPEEVEAWKLRSEAAFFLKHYGLPGIAGLYCNLALQTALIWGPLALSAAAFGRPRDIGRAKRHLARAWREYNGVCAAGPRGAAL